MIAWRQSRAIPGTLRQSIKATHTDLHLKPICPDCIKTRIKKGVVSYKVNTDVTRCVVCEAWCDQGLHVREGEEPYPLIPDAQLTRWQMFVKGRRQGFVLGVSLAALVNAIVAVWRVYGH